MLKWIAGKIVVAGEKRIGVALEYAHKIAQTDFGLMLRYGKIFGFLDPNKNVPAPAYHVARLRGAIAADCGTCVEAEINLAKNAKVPSEVIAAVLQSDYSALPDELSAVARLADAVTAKREDDPEAREKISKAYGDTGLIEISFAMNGAALLPGIKRSMGYATVCDIQTIKKLV
ncbi:MAG: hypothetical protein ABJK39_15675 [Hyphomicrobiales bacterium]